ncbi:MULTISPECIES: hypothetical protein [Parasutterella]|jgi:hypothetical protein|uniref:hypothetical protein n=1 Tax=Parasutterella TaxID=577310 RepID=UPI00242EF18F|nr:hypothetical protein [Parasutterella excrementihominis]
MRIEIIKWVDTFGCPPGWEFEDELEYKVTEVTSVGFIRKETDTVVVLVPHISGADRKQIAGHICIPRKQILSRQTIFSSEACDQELALKQNLPGS